MLERAPFDLRGGNSRFTAGGMRFAYEGNAEIRALVPDLSESELSRTDFGAYTRDQFYDDMCRITQYRTDADLAVKLVDESFDTLKWMAGQGVRFPADVRPTVVQDRGHRPVLGRFDPSKLGAADRAWWDSLTDIAKGMGIDVRYGVRGEALAPGGVRVGAETVEADAVVLACGGFESNAAWRAQYLGAGWELAKVRGTRFNTGDGIRMAIDAGAASRGNWSGCHAVAWDMNAPEFGDLDVGDNFQKHSYPLGVMLNAEGEIASSTRGRTFATTPMRNTVARYLRRRGSSPTRSSTPRCPSCCATNIAFAK